MPKDTFFNLPNEKRQILLDIAIEEFANNDYRNASISRIVAQAGIAKGSFYQYFENKADLYQFLIDLGMQKKAEFLNMPSPEPNIDIFAYLQWMIKAGIRFELTNPKLSQIGYRAIKNNDLPESSLTQGKNAAHIFFKQLVERGKTEGSIAENIDTDLSAFIFHLVFTELGQYMMARFESDMGDSLSSGESQFDSPEATHIFKQTLHILQSGMMSNMSEEPGTT